MDYLINSAQPLIFRLTYEAVAVGMVGLVDSHRDPVVSDSLEWTFIGIISM